MKKILVALALGILAPAVWASGHIYRHQSTVAASTIAPGVETTITSGPAGVTGNSSATFTFSASEPATFSCSIDGSIYSSCSSPKVYTALTGALEHSFSVRATSLGGNVDSSPATRTWTVGLVLLTCSGTCDMHFVAEDWPGGAANWVSRDANLWSVAPSGTLTKIASQFLNREQIDFAGSRGFSGTVGSTAHCLKDQDTTFEWLLSSTTPTGNTAVLEVLNDPTDPTGDLIITEYTNTDGGSPYFDKVFAKTMVGGDLMKSRPTEMFTLTFNATTEKFAFYRGGVVGATNVSWSPPACVPNVLYLGFDPSDAEINTGLLLLEVVRHRSVLSDAEILARATPFNQLVAPITTLAPTGPTGGSGISFVFEVSDAATTVCTLDLGSAACSSPQTFTELADGAHAFSVAAMSLFGVSEIDPPAYAWVVDTTPPVTTITSGPSGPTASTDATFEFVADEPATFICQLDGAAPIACVSPKAYTGLAAGTGHLFYVRGCDARNNCENPGKIQFWTIL